MKKVIAALCFTSVLTLAAYAAETPSSDAGAQKPAVTEEQKEFRKQMLAKYDANKDGKLDKQERASFSAEDKAKWAELNPKKPAGETQQTNQ